MCSKTAGSCWTAKARGCARTAISRNSISDKPPAATAAAIVPSSNIAAAGGGMAELTIESLRLRFGGLVVLAGISPAVAGGRARSPHPHAGGLRCGPRRLVVSPRALAREPALLLLDEPSAGLNRDERE